MSRRRLLIAHPGATSLLYPLVALLQRMDLEVRFETLFYDRPGDTLHRVARILPSRIGAKLARELGRRSHPDIDPVRVATAPFSELVHIASARLLSPATTSAVLRWRNARFDARIAAMIRRERPDFFIGFDGSAERSFEACRESGTISLLYQAIGHLRSGLRTLMEEHRLSPEFAGVSFGDTSEEWIARNAREALLADRVVVPSDYVRDTMIENGRDAATIDLLPFPIDVARFTPAAAARDDGKLRALFVGQIGLRKGVKYVLEAARLLARPDIEIVLVGGMVDGSEWLKRYDGLYRHVANVPYAEMPAIFRAADVFVFPSLHEGSAMAVNEALASGLPAIVTPNAGAIVRDGIEGFVVPLRDAAAVADRLALLADDPTLRRRMAAAARTRAEAHDAAAYAARLGALLDRLKPPA
ncbi:MAG: glycosyltransferase family 4 protein [Reyranellaceae bacterium]